MRIEVRDEAGASGGYATVGGWEGHRHTKGRASEGQRETPSRLKHQTSWHLSHHILTPSNPTLPTCELVHTDRDQNGSTPSAYSPTRLGGPG